MFYRLYVLKGDFLNEIENDFSCSRIDIKCL